MATTWTTAEKAFVRMPPVNMPQSWTREVVQPPFLFCSGPLWGEWQQVGQLWWQFWGCGYLSTRLWSEPATHFTKAIYDLWISSEQPTSVLLMIREVLTIRYGWGSIGWQLCMHSNTDKAPKCHQFQQDWLSIWTFLSEEGYSSVLLVAAVFLFKKFQSSNQGAETISCDIGY